MAIELAQEGLKRAGFAPDIEIMPWKRAVFMAKEGEADALFYAVLNKERTRFFHYPETPLFTLQVVALKRAKSTIEINHGNYDNLNRWTLGVGRGFSYGAKVRYFIQAAQFERVESTTSNEINVSKLLDNRVDLILIDRALGRSFIDKHREKLEFVTDSTGNIAILDSHNAYLVFSKKTRTERDAVNFSKALRSMKEDGTYQEILARYQ